MGKFQIPSVPPTTNKTIRFPNDVLEGVEQAIQGKDCTFSAFVVAGGAGSAGGFGRELRITGREDPFFFAFLFCFFAFRERFPGKYPLYR